MFQNSFERHGAKVSEFCPEGWDTQFEDSSEADKIGRLSLILGWLYEFQMFCLWAFCAWSCA